MWTIIRDTSAFQEAMKLAKGCYQKSLLEGYENLSGSTLKGKARVWGGKYAISRRNLLKRIREAKIPVSEITGNNNKRILVIG